MDQPHFKDAGANWMFLLHPALTALLTACFEKRETITPIAWLMPLAGQPPLLAMALKPTRFSYKLLKGAGQFAINLPFFADAEKVWDCGTTSGKDTDKFQRTGYTRISAEVVNAPLIGESAGFLECKLFDDRPYGDHRLIVGEVLRAVVREDLFTDSFRHYPALLHIHKNLFLPPDWSQMNSCREKTKPVK